MAKLRKFYDLDNAAKIFPVVANESRSYVFRLAVIFKEEIDKDLMQLALNKTTLRFKHLNVRMRKGLFWYYLEENFKQPLLLEEKGHVNQYLYFKENNDFLFRALYYKNRLSIEFFHALTDGKGALEFINSLSYEYLTLRGNQIKPEGLVITSDAEGTYKEVEDAFRKLYQNQKIVKLEEPRAHHLKGTFYADYHQAVMHAYLDAKNVIEVAKSYDASVTELIVSIIILSAKRSGGVAKYKHLFRVFVPVNMRQFYPAITLRNFASYLRVNADLNKDLNSLKEIIDSVKEFMKQELNLELMVNRSIGNVKTELNPVLRMTPLPIKKIAMKTVYGVIGANMNSFDISNLGRVEIPLEMKEHISHYNFVIGTSKSTPKSLGVISFNNTMTLSFISNIIERDFEKAFFEILAQHNLEMEIESNNWEVI